MGQTRAQRAAKRARNPEEQDRHIPTRKRRRGKKSSEEPLIQGHNRAIEDNRDLSPQNSPKSRQRSNTTIPTTSGNVAADNTDPDNPIEFWRRKGRWPRQYFEPDMEHLLARKRSLSAVGGRKRANSTSSTTPSDQKPREEKSTQYRNPQYETLLATKGSYMIKSNLDVDIDSKALCRQLLEKEQSLPENSLFHDDLFESTCEKIHNRNEARVVQDISRLIVPSAESLATYGAKHLEVLIESVNEGWNNSIPLTGTRPQSDYSVGFQRQAFSEEQLEKLAPFIGDYIGGDLSYFMATYLMYFPFLACEVKCGTAALDVADRQNAHSMTLAARGIVELFRLVKRESEVHRKIISFSVSHDHRSVRIYGYYPVINGNDTKYYRHPIHEFSFTALDGKERWTTYRFTKNIYDTWVPDHLKRICSVIDQLPSKVNFDVRSLSESTSLSQDLGSQLALSKADPALLQVDDEDGHSARFGQIATPDTSISKPKPSKRRRSPVKNA